mmetsp:Transcript_8283/g.12475  ORF Transcript_8283/g.12475 Transcript_8283/m.12475 type:complete len:472 (-) Transcript_8283:50-1465(-)
MGKKKGAAIRAQKRADEAAAELLEQTIENQEVAKYEAKEDNELFVLDSTPDVNMNVNVNVNNTTSKGKRRKKQHSSSSLPFSTSLNIKQGKKNRISELDEKQIKKILETHSTEKVISMASAQEKILKQRKRSRRVAGNAKANFDLWGEEEDGVGGGGGDGTKKRKMTKPAATKLIPVKSGVAAAGGTAPIEFKSVSKKSLRKDIQQPAELSNKQLKMRQMLKEKARKSVQVELAQPGQSYRPDEEQHQDAIGEALSIELRRKEAIEYGDAPIGGGKMSDETMALLVHSSDEESSDSDDDDEDGDNETSSASVTAVKRKEKLTRSERNKQKRVKALKVALDEKKRVKKLLNSLQDAKRISKEIRKEEAERIARKEEINALKEDQKSKPLGINLIEKISQLDPIHAPALPVALTEELKDGSLRTVKPKGSLLTDRMESMISRKMANRKSLSKKRVVHGKRRMKGGKGREFLLA